MVIFSGWLPLTWLGETTIMNANARRLFGLLALTVLLAARPVHADIILDMDAIAPGFEPSITVTSGSSITIKAKYIPFGSLPTFNAVGLDVSYGFAGDTATATIAGLPKAGMQSGLAGGGSSTNLVGSPGVTPGTPLPTISIGAPFSGVSHIGGAGYFDPTPSFFSGTTTPATASLDLMGWDFVITGAPGTFVTFQPTGIFVPGSFGAGTSLAVVPKAPATEVFYNSMTGVTSGPQSIPPMGTFKAFIAVPEPSSLGVLGFLAIGIQVRRRRLLV